MDADHKAVYPGRNPGKRPPFCPIQQNTRSSHEYASQDQFYGERAKVYARQRPWNRRSQQSRFPNEGRKEVNKRHSSHHSSASNKIQKFQPSSNTAYRFEQIHQINMLTRVFYNTPKCKYFLAGKHCPDQVLCEFVHHSATIEMEAEKKIQSDADSDVSREEGEVS
ncbi:hypothetical protein ACOME3_003018 [Neoechinorhynchus agilis]